MKKFIKIACIAIAALILVVLVVVFFALNGIVKTAVETVLHEVTGVPVRLEGVSISMLSGKGTLTGFLIGNPEGFNTDHAFALGTVRVDVALPSLLSDKIVIEEIYIDGPEVTYEAGLTGSNIGKIQENVEKFAGPPAEEAEEPEEEGEAKKIQINRFVFKNGKIALSAKLLQGKALTVPLPDVELKDIGKEEDGKSIGEAAKDVILPLGNQIIAAAKAGLENAKELLGARVDKAKDAGEAVTDKAKGVGEGVKGIFGK